MSSAQPVRKSPSSVHSTRWAPPGDDDLHVARGAAVRIAATAAAHAPVPDASVGPTPRSQIRIRTRSGASTAASSTFVPSGKCGCTASAAATVCSRSSVTSPSTTHCGLPTRSVTASTACRRRRSSRARSAPAAPSPRGTCSGRSRRRAARGASRRRRSRSRSAPCPASARRAATRATRAEAAHAVARHFRVAAVGVEQLHRRASCGLVDRRSVRRRRCRGGARRRRARAPADRPAPDDVVRASTRRKSLPKRVRLDR